jgi:hypothetical protein
MLGFERDLKRRRLIARESVLDASYGFSKLCIVRCVYKYIAHLKSINQSINHAVHDWVLHSHIAPLSVTSIVYHMFEAVKLVRCGDW